MSRLFYAVTRDGGFPPILDHLNPRTKVPARILLALLSCFAVVLIICYISHVDLETALILPSGATILIYVLGSAAGLKILGGPDRRTRMNLILPSASLVISLMVLPFIGPLLIVSLAVIPAALAYMALTKRAA